MEKFKKRRSYFIADSFQLKFIFKFCLLIICASFLTGGLIYYFNLQTTTVAFENLKVVVKSTSDFILPMMLGILLIVTILIGIATIIITLFTSHKIAGPLYRLKLDLEKIKCGDFSSAIQIRAGDQLQKVAAELDEIRLALKTSINTLRENWISMKINLRNLMEESRDEDRKNTIAENIEKIDSELASFKID